MTLENPAKPQEQAAPAPAAVGAGEDDTAAGGTGATDAAPTLLT